MTPPQGNLHAQLEELRLETLLADLSARFVGLPAQALDREIEGALRHICQTLGLDCSTLLQFSGPDGEAVSTHSWATEGFKPTPLVPISKLFPWGLKRIQNGQSVQFTSVDELPAEAATDKESLRRLGPKSNVTFPLIVGGERLGALAFGALKAERRWPERLVNRLRLITGMFASALARRRSDEALRESAERLKLATDLGGVGLWSMGLEARRVWASSRMYELFQFAAGEELTLDRFFKVIHPEDRETVQQAGQCAVETDAPFLVEYRVVLPDGTLRWISTRGQRHCQPSGKPDRLMGVSVDITQRRAMELELARHRTELAHISRISTMGELTTSLAHELNQPLGAILRNAEAAELLLQANVPDLEELHAIVADIRQDDERASNVIDRLRGLLKRQNLELQPVGLARLVDEVVSLLRPDAMGRRIQLETDVPANLSPVWGDRVHLQQVLLNLIMNGADAMEHAQNGDRRMVIRARLAGDRLIEVAVSDSGPGIPPETITRIFEPFFTTKAGGMGMGLPISRTIIEAHDGRIWAENNATRGATFYFTLTTTAAAGGAG